jgi:hypothetical protein
MPSLYGGNSTANECANGAMEIIRFYDQSKVIIISLWRMFWVFLGCLLGFNKDNQDYPYYDYTQMSITNAIRQHNRRTYLPE